MPIERIGRYDVEGVLGAGGFATEYRAVDPRLDAKVAIKVLAENWSLDPDVRRRFRTEAVLLRRLQSQGSVPGLIEVHDIDETEDGRPFFVMGFADRGTLRHRIGEQAWAPQFVVPIIDSLAAAVGAIHAAGVVHRDLKPSNLLVRTDRGVTQGDPEGLLRPGERLVVGDLGLAKDLNVDTTALSVAGGTARYSAPEQLDPAGSVNHRADIYAATVIVRELLTGSSSAGVTLPPQLDAVLSKGHAERADDRFDSMGQWRSALLEALGAPDHARRTGEIPAVSPTLTGSSFQPPAAAPGSSDAADPPSPAPPAAPPRRTPPLRPTRLESDPDSSPARPVAPPPVTATPPNPADGQPDPLPAPSGSPAMEADPPPAVSASPGTDDDALVGAKPRRSNVALFGLLAVVVLGLGGFGLFRLSGGSTIIGPDSIEVGQLVRYRADAPAESLVEWTDWTGATLTGQDLQVQARLPGSLSFSLSVDGSDPETKTISVVPSEVGPSIQGPAIIPLGQTTQFFASTEPGDLGHFWLDGDGNRVDQDVLSITPQLAEPITIALISIGADGIERGIRRTIEVSQ